MLRNCWYLVKTSLTVYLIFHKVNFFETLIIFSESNYQFNYRDIWFPKVIIILIITAKVLFFNVFFQKKTSTLITLRNLMKCFSIIMQDRYFTKCYDFKSHSFPFHLENQARLKNMLVCRHPVCFCEYTQLVRKTFLSFWDGKDGINPCLYFWLKQFFWWMNIKRSFWSSRFL